MFHKYRRCTYCKASMHQDYLTNLPIRDSAREKWFNALGPDFKNACINQSRPMICLSHFENVKNFVRPLFAIPMPLPFCNNNLGVKTKRKRSIFKKGPRKNAKVDAHHGVMAEANGRVEPVEEAPEIIILDEQVTSQQRTQIPILHCYNCGSSFKNVEPNPESFVKTVICRKCSRPPNLFQSYPIRPWNDFNRRETQGQTNQFTIGIHQMHPLGRHTQAVPDLTNSFDWLQQYNMYQQSIFKSLFN